MSKIETTTIASLKLASRINLGRPGKHSYQALNFGHHPQAPNSPERANRPLHACAKDYHPYSGIPKRMQYPVKAKHNCKYLFSYFSLTPCISQQHWETA